MKSLYRVLSVGFCWAGLEALVLLFSVILLGSSETYARAANNIAGPNSLAVTPVVSGIVPSFPIGLLILPMSFGFGFALADISETIRATALATFTAFMSALLIVAFFAIPFPGAVSQGDAQATFFGFLSLVFFLLGMVGGSLGSITGSWARSIFLHRPM